ncbi:MAG: hypothetical protein QXV93_01620 [Zestosphaera sp.]
MIIEVIAFSALIIASAISVIWYFRGRRKMLKFIKEFTDELERELRPADKEYVLLGYLVGYRAKYKLEDGRNAYILLTTAPRHSFFYYLIARALNREDRVTIMLELTGRNVLRDLHAVKKGESRILNVLLRDLGSRAERLSRTIIKTSKGDYEVFYEEPRDLELINKIIDSRPKPIIKLSAYKSLNAVEVVSRAELGSVNELLGSLKILARNISKSLPSHN